jgi:hypothetical protein
MPVKQVDEMKPVVALTINEIESNRTDVNFDQVHSALTELGLLLELAMDKLIKDSTAH